MKVSALQLPMYVCTERSTTVQYVRYKRGNCSFTVNLDGEQPTSWKHVINFDTYPNSMSINFTCMNAIIN